MLNVDDFLTFSNAALVAFSFCVLVELARYLHRRSLHFGGFGQMFSEMWRAWLRFQDTYGEFAVAFSALVVGVFIRGSTLLYWRALGHGPFPFIPAQIGDCFTWAGCLCVIRCLSETKPRNWPWMAYSAGCLAFSLGAVILKRSLS